MGVLCQILLKTTEEGVFRPGEPVAGTLRYTIDKPGKFDNIYISFVGKGTCRWSESDTDNGSRYYSNKEDYVTLYNYTLTAAHHKILFLPGTHEIPFEFILPDDIPTSIKDNICTIEYKVKVKFVKANFFNTAVKFDAEVPVYGYVSPCVAEPLIFGLKKELLSFTSNNKVFVNGEIDKTFVTPGENITLKLKINNDSDVAVTIKTELIKHFTYVASNKSKKLVCESVKTTKRNSPSLRKKSVSNLTCIVPTLPSLYSIQHANILIGEFKVRVTVKLPFPHIKASVVVPVVIGESRNRLGAAILYDEKPSSSKMPEEVDEYSYKDYFEKYDNNIKQLRVSQP